MSIKVLRPGLLTTIQDLGRYGYQKYGVIVSGAMDTYAHRMANILVGNNEGEGCLEITLTGPTLEIKTDVLLSITGGNLSPSIGNRQLPLWRPVFVKKGSIIRFGKGLSGCRAYVAVAGGFNVADVMGSKSTYIRAEIGGFHGRALQEGDEIRIGKGESAHFHYFSNTLKKSGTKLFYAPTWRTKSHVNQAKNEVLIRVMQGTHHDLFTEEAQKQFFTSSFHVTPQSDRMGYRLKGPQLELNKEYDVISEAVPLGTIQVPSDGNPIILLADRQTTGGYPRIGQVISVDIPKLAQLKPGEKIVFNEVTLEEAENLYLMREREFKDVKMGIWLKWLND
ncbi:biotin-dependent carboxyltransferase family protein [Bacillus sp. FJAT-45037]|uniref:5-oxoprolinase subunit C family protein n=1 Tax=Bacillus sp. FJAT-45037 TaxID=2011007 RepID=UPI000C2417D2|nr:biotin-dependent carboxyltransferase family protein [Bacillus sp. FJAT-45037]